MIPTKTIQLDFWRHPTDILHLVQGEADGRKIQFKITDNGSAADLTGFIAIFAIKKPDGNVVVNSATITEAELGIVETTISSQVVTTAGNAHAELHLMKEGQLSKSFRIVTKVAPGVDIDGIAPSVSEFNALQTLIGQAETVISIADTDLWPEVVANAQYFSDLAGAGRMTETVKANADDIANRARTLNNGALQTVTNKNKYYPLLSNVDNTLMASHQTNVWTGSAWAASNNYGVGYAALSSNTGANSNGVGYAALSSNTGSSSNGVGYSALLNNTGGASNGFGYAALQNNIGIASNGFGYNALLSNTDAASNGVGYNALSSNTGANSNGVGYAALIYNQSPRNTAIGHNANSAFIENAAGAKTCANTDINITDERATITAHGFGADNAIVNLKYTATTGTAIGGLALDTIFQAKIIDANTIEFVNGSQKRNLTSAGTGTHTFTPQFAYSNTTCLGASTVPNKSNQVVLGDTSVDTVKMGGTARTPASATATGVKGEMCWDANYIYICVATNTWKRSALSTWP